MDLGERLKALRTAKGYTVADLMGAPAGIEEEALESVPDSLRGFVRRRGKVLGVRREDVEMLKQIHYRGQRPGTPEDWELIFLFIRRILG